MRICSIMLYLRQITDIFDMGRFGKDFRRFPHTCEIYTMTDSTPFSDGEKVTVWSGVCRKERMGDGTRDNVIIADYRIQLGNIINGKEIGAIVSGIKSGMIIDVTDMQGSFTLTVKDAYAGQLGTSVFADAGAYASVDDSVTGGSGLPSPFG